MDCNSILTNRYSENEKFEIKIFRTCVCRCIKNKNDKMHLLFYYIDCYLKHTKDAYITFFNFQILIKKYIEMFLNYEDISYFLGIFGKNYFCSLIIKKNDLNQDFVLKLFNNINFLTLFYEKYSTNIKTQYNSCNVIDFLIQNENLFCSKTDGEDNILNDIDDVTRKMEKINLD